MEWTEEGIRTYVDDQTILRVDFDQSFWERGEFPEWAENPWSAGETAAPFDEEFFLVRYNHNSREEKRDSSTSQLRS